MKKIKILIYFIILSFFYIQMCLNDIDFPFSSYIRYPFEFETRNRQYSASTKSLLYKLEIILISFEKLNGRFPNNSIEIIDSLNKKEKEIYNEYYKILYEKNIKEESFYKSVLLSVFIDRKTKESIIIDGKNITEQKLNDFQVNFPIPKEARVIYSVNKDRTIYAIYGLDLNKDLIVDRLNRVPYSLTNNYIIIES